MKSIQFFISAWSRSANLAFCENESKNFQKFAFDFFLFGVFYVQNAWQVQDADF